MSLSEADVEGNATSVAFPSRVTDTVASPEDAGDARSCNKVIRTSPGGKIVVVLDASVAPEGIGAISCLTSPLQR